MARFIETLEVQTSQAAAFDHVADFATTADWDPGVAAAERLDAGPLDVGARFEVRAKIGLATVPLLYEITTYDRPDRVVLTTVGRWYRGEDDVRFESTGDATRVIWAATFSLRGPARLLDPALAVAFRRTVTNGVAGLETSLVDLAGR